MPKIRINLRSFYAWLRWKNWCINKSKMQQSAKETDLANKSYRKIQKIVTDENIRSVCGSSQYMKQTKCHCVFYIVFHRLRFDWRSFNYIITSCSTFFF